MSGKSVTADCSLARLRVLSKLCKLRGGTCDCMRECKAKTVAGELSNRLREKIHKIDREIYGVESIIKRLDAPIATLREGFTFADGLVPVMVFDGDEATFGYEDAAGDWIEANEWPFNESFVWFDDCERNGIRVE